MICVSYGASTAFIFMEAPARVSASKPQINFVLLQMFPNVATILCQNQIRNLSVLFPCEVGSSLQQLSATVGDRKVPTMNQIESNQHSVLLQFFVYSLQALYRNASTVAQARVWVSHLTSQQKFRAGISAWQPWALALASIPVGLLLICEVWEVLGLSPGVSRASADAVAHRASRTGL